ncbi:BRCA1-associated RING domain protein 1 isoform X2 [Salminus brasiliensis]|uniref:BRCA1-associated RING domain protein 1 isoform X2 n=1 Tax=Salminus brasiliensis TaxID=930266 RepID=UPI003B833BBA
MGPEPAVESEEDTWGKTREAVAHFRKLLLCSKCSNILTEPVCLGICEHLLCRSCAGPQAGDGCSVCHSPAWVKDIQINRQLSNITELFLNLESLLCRQSDVQASPAESSTCLNETSVLKQKKNFKIWFSPRSRKVRCRVEKPVEDSGSSSPQRERGSDGRKKKRKKRNARAVSKRTSNNPRPPTRNQTKQKLKKMRLEAVNQQWGFSKDGAVHGEGKEEEEDDEKNVGDAEGKISKRVYFQCPDGQPEPQLVQEAPPQGVPSPRRSILKEGTVKETKLSSEEQKSAVRSIVSHCDEQTDLVMETEPVVDIKIPARPSPGRTPKRARLEEQRGSPQSTPKRPKLSPGRRRRSAPGRATTLSTPPPSPDCSSLHSVPERARKDQEGSPGSSPATGKRTPVERHSQSSPAYMKRNHKGETPLHLAAIKGDVEATKELLAQGADPNLKDHAGWTPLHEACNLGHLGVVEVLLLQGALLNTPGYENDSPLHDAVRNGHVAVARVLLEHGASPNVLNKVGLRPVDYAVTQEMKEILRVGPEAPQPVTTHLTSPASLSKSASVIRRDVPVTLMGSKLTQAQQNQLIKAARVLGGKRVETFSSAVTHVVVPDGPVPTTLTALQGILSGCWIVSFSWLADSLQQRRWLEEGEFEKGEGPQQARVNRDNLLPRLFDGCFFYLLGSFQKPPKNELLQLVKAGGGQLLSRQPKPDSDVTQTLSSAAYHAQPGSDQAFCTQYILYGPEGSYRPDRIRLGKVWSAPSSWLLDCIKAFSLLPVPEL